MSELEPTPELPDETPTCEVRFPTRIKNVLLAAGLKTVGEVREMSDDALLRLPGFGKPSVAQLRETLGPGKKPA
jgi:DNA-directed RNA polymerase alpha subunit